MENYSSMARERWLSQRGQGAQCGNNSLSTKDAGDGPISKDMTEMLTEMSNNMQEMKTTLLTLQQAENDRDMLTEMKDNIQDMNNTLLTLQQAVNDRDMLTEMKDHMLDMKTTLLIWQEVVNDQDMLTEMKDNIQEMKTTLLTLQEVVNNRDMLTEMKDNIQEMKTTLLTLQQAVNVVKAPEASIEDVKAEEENNAEFQDIVFKIPDDEDDVAIQNIENLKIENEDECGICHKDASGNMVLVAPCGHYPFCASCTSQLEEEKRNVPFLSRSENWASYIFICPYCKGLVTETFTIKKVKGLFVNIM